MHKNAPDDQKVISYKRLSRFLVSFGSTYPSISPDKGIDGTFCKGELKEYLNLLSTVSLPANLRHGIDFGSSYGAAQCLIVETTGVNMIGFECNPHRWQLSQILQGDLVKASGREPEDPRYLERGSEISHKLHFVEETSQSTEMITTTCMSLEEEINNISFVFWFSHGWNKE